MTVAVRNKTKFDALPQKYRNGLCFVLLRCYAAINIKHT